MEGSLPSPRSGHGFASLNDDQVYLFGGQGPNGHFFNDLHVHDPIANSWTDLSSSTETTPPTARAYHGFTSAGGRLYVHGGKDALGNVLGLIHTFDPVAMAWTDLSDALRGVQPPARFRHGFASASGKLYVYGGCTTNACSPLDKGVHIFDPAARGWAYVEAIERTWPLARYSHGFVSAGGKVYLHGGIKAGADYIFDPVTTDVWDSHAMDSWTDELCVFDPVSMAWTNLSEVVHGNIPSARWDHGFTFLDGKLYVHGGCTVDACPANDLFALNLSTYTWTDLALAVSGTPPAARFSHGFTSVAGMLKVHGGCTNYNCINLIGKLHSFDPITTVWTDLADASTGKLPTARHSHGFASARGKLYIHGGNDLNRYNWGDLHSFNPRTNSWSNLSDAVKGTPPIARSYHGFASAAGKLYVHGGWGEGDNDFSDLHAFDPVTLVWTNLSMDILGTPPSARNSHGFTSAGGKLYVHGGMYFDPASLAYFVVGEQGLHVFDPSVKAWTDLAYAPTGDPPTSRAYHGFASVDGTIYVHCGCNTVDESGDNCLLILSDFHSFDPVTMVWTDLSDAVRGSRPTARFSHGFASAGGKLFVLGGAQYSATNNAWTYLNDFYMFDPVARLWTDLEVNAGNAVPARYSHGFASVAGMGRLFVHGGFGISGYLLDLRGITSPREISLSEAAGLRMLVFVFDWDTLLLLNNVTVYVSSPLTLCTNAWPCALQLRGGAVELHRDSQLQCFASTSCSSISIDSVAIRCHDTIRSVFKMEGSLLILSNTSFVGCRSNTDGGVVQAYALAEVIVRKCNFIKVHSNGFGGVFAAYGSNLSISDSHFHNCSSSGGGGAIWASAFQECYGSNRTNNTSLHLASSVFSLCSTGGAGGAVLASAPSSFGGVVSLEILISSTRFSNCSSTANGGAISIFGNPVSVQVEEAWFESCSTDGAGGAICATDSSSLSLVGCNFKGNEANGIGGGAIHLSRSNFAAYNTTVSNCVAPMGGGGALLWDGSVGSAPINCPPDTVSAHSSCDGVLGSTTACSIGTCESSIRVSKEQPTPQDVQQMRSSSEVEKSADNSPESKLETNSAILNSLCGQNNSAVYGQCLATTYWMLLVPNDIHDKNSGLAYPGLSFFVTVYKKDAYNQTIASDSTSLIQIHTSLGGLLQPDSSISLLGAGVIRLEQGAATFNIQLKPSYSNVVPSAGLTMLQTNPFIYFQGQDAEASFNILQSPTYSVALSVGFNICPSGYILVLDPPNLLWGPAQCQLCLAGTYSVSPLSSTGGFLNSSNPACVNCPAGGSCLQGGNTVIFARGETWLLDTFLYRLVHCPRGTTLINTINEKFSHDVQQCRQCLPSEYVLNPDTDTCQACPPGLSCAGLDIVTQVLAGSMWTQRDSIYLLVGCPTGHSVMCVGTSGRFDASVQQCSPCLKGEECVSVPCVTCSPCLPDFYKSTESKDACVPCPIDTYNTLHGAQELSACQPCPEGALCADGSKVCALRNKSFLACPSGSSIIGSWTLDNNSGRYGLVRCPGGYVRNSDRCQECPASFYCVDGLLTSCASGQFSLPGSSTVSSCAPAVFVVVVINIPISRLFFVQTTTFQTRLAAFVGVDPLYVIVSVIQTGKKSSTTDVKSEIATKDASAADALSKSFAEKSGEEEQWFLAMGSQFEGTFLVSVEATACITGYELQAQPPPSTCQLCVANYYCPGGASGRSPCPDGGFSPAGANASSSCKHFAVSVVVALPIPVINFTVSHQMAFVYAVAKTAGISSELVSQLSIITISMKRVATSLQVTTQIAVESATEAAILSNKLDATALNVNLAAAGLPASLFVLIDVKSSNPDSHPGAASILWSTIISGACFLFVLLVSVAGYRLVNKILKQRDHTVFVVAFSNAKVGDTASPSTLPLKLRHRYTADLVIGKGAFGCVIKAKRNGSNHFVAIKVLLPGKISFDDKEIRSLKREARVHELFMSRKCEYGAHLSGSTGVVEVHPMVAWIIMEYLEGEDMDRVVHPHKHRIKGQIEDDLAFSRPVSDTECIAVARSILAALKVMHAEGLVHRDVKPANIVRCCNHVDGKNIFSTKLIDFGSGIGVDEAVAKGSMMTMIGNRALAVGTPPYMSPEMFKEPETATYSTDVWSLGVSMFELVTGWLPFHLEDASDSALLWSLAIAGNMDDKAPEVLDELPEGRRSIFDRNLNNVIAKALEKRVGDRYASADEMHDAVYACLIERGEACYSAFISYRVASDAPLARLLFDELNHSITPGGHRVTVYWDAHRLVKGEDWEEGFATGLLNSLVFLPLLSYGFTAPLAALPGKIAAKESIYNLEDKPMGRHRLVGSESDPEDNCLKELLITYALLKQRKLRKAGETVPMKLQLAYSILVGRHHPKGHADYPRMGNFFTVQGGGGSYPDKPSPPTARAVSAFLREKAGFAAEDAKRVESVSVMEAVTAMTRLQGCQLWDHAKVSRLL